ncbi:Tyrosine-protein kinase JAK1 [Colletotrichum shisoi]|uniref:Tyrosine-protein kinase JAK1 n=1 Tax=Colletotrichum shisoi TaxID=2078593 RepID=A0A5Q4C372_9PEZI|nr:Tyrosine-protein kinase JAK1 [Colletotrichum shisoi]
MGLAPIAIFINSRIKVLMRTDHSVIYFDKTEPEVALKAETIWIDGVPYGLPSMAAQTSFDLSREHDVYTALGCHQCITRCFGLVHDDNGNAIALKLERASKGNLRHFIEETPEVPSMYRRLEMADALVKCVAYIHSRGVVWGDLSTRNVLVFDDDSLKVCDFASSALDNVYPHFGIHTYEPGYCPALPEDQVRALSMMQRELYALGSAVLEVTAWKFPYADVSGDIWGIIESGTMPVIADNNPARDIITRCWDFGYDSAEAVADDLADVLVRLRNNQPITQMTTNGT